MQNPPNMRIIDVLASATLSGPRTKLKRHAERGSHERQAVEAVIDEAPLCHLAFSVDGEAMALPTAHARVDDQLYVHGAIAASSSP